MDSVHSPLMFSERKNEAKPENYFTIATYYGINVAIE